MNNKQEIELTEVNNVVPSDEKLFKEMDISLLKDVNVQLEAVVGKTTIAVNDLFSLKKGEVLPLEQSVNDDIFLKLNNEIVAAGRLVAVDGCFGIEITSVLDS